MSTGMLRSRIRKISRFVAPSFFLLCFVTRRHKKSPSDCQCIFAFTCVRDRDVNSFMVGISTKTSLAGLSLFSKIHTATKFSWYSHHSRTTEQHNDNICKICVWWWECMCPNVKHVTTKHGPMHSVQECSMSPRTWPFRDTYLNCVLDTFTRSDRLILECIFAARVVTCDSQVCRNEKCTHGNANQPFTKHLRSTPSLWVLHTPYVSPRKLDTLRVCLCQTSTHQCRCARSSRRPSQTSS